MRRAKILCEGGENLRVGAERVNSIRLVQWVEKWLRITWKIGAEGVGARWGRKMHEMGGLVSAEISAEE